MLDITSNSVMGRMLLVSISKNCCYDFIFEVFKTGDGNLNSRHHSWNITMLSPAGVRRSSIQQLGDNTHWGCQGLDLDDCLFVICAQGKMLGRRVPSCQHLLLWSGTVFVPFTFKNPSPHLPPPWMLTVASSLLWVHFQGAFFPWTRPSSILIENTPTPTPGLKPGSTTCCFIPKVEAYD